LKKQKNISTKGHFPPGSMGPKISAIVKFLEGGGKIAYSIVKLRNILKLLKERQEQQ